MDNIKEYFYLSVNDNGDKDKDTDNKFEVNRICNKAHDDKNEIIQGCSDSFDETSIKDSNQHFIRRIQNLEEENDRLLSIIENNKLIAKNDSKCNTDLMPDIAVKKISQLTANIKELKSELQIFKSSTICDNNKNIVQEDNNSIKIKQLIDELNSANKKNCGYRNDIKQLKTNLQIAQNALLNEVGDPTMMQAVLSGTGSPNSVGRAQQILILKQKVKELEAKQNSSNDKIESSLKETIRKMEKTREIDHQALKDAQLKICKLNKSLDKFKCQREASESGMNAIRMQKEELLSKSEHDKELIDKLKAELNDSNFKLSKTKDSVMKLEELVKSQKTEFEKAQQIIEQQASILKENDETILTLKSQVLKFEETVLNRNTCTMNFLDPKDVFIKKLNEFENQQLKELLCLAHDHICAQILNFKDKYLMDKQKSKKNNLKIEVSSSFTSLSQKSNNILHKLKTESNEKLNDLLYKLEQAKEECEALKDKLNILTIVHKKHVQAFKETLSKQYEDAINKLNEILT